MGSIIFPIQFLLSVMLQCLTPASLIDPLLDQSSTVKVTLILTKNTINLISVFIRYKLFFQSSYDILKFV
jgi:hypothetical protein